MIERTEELGLAGHLPISVGGRRVELRTLNLDESEKWLARLDDIGRMEVNRLPTEVLLGLVMAYDVDGQLASADTSQFTKRELFDAANQMASAEDPFLEDARSAAVASGAKHMAPLTYQLVIRSLPANSTNGASQSGASTRRHSGKASLKSVS